jgi:hypothetical protein
VEILERFFVCFKPTTTAREKNSENVSAENILFYVIQCEIMYSHVFAVVFAIITDWMVFAGEKSETEYKNT